LVGLFLIALSGCVAAPAVEFRTYAEASDAVAAASLQLLDDYAQAMAQPAETEAADVPTRFDPDAAGAAAVAGITERRGAVAALREYDRILLFLAEGGSYDAVRARIGGLAGLLGGVFPPLGIASGTLGELAATLERARSAQEFRTALQAARLPPPPGGSCATPLPATVAAADLRPPERLAACQPAVDALFALLRADTASFYAAQLGLYARGLDADLRAFREAARPLYLHAAQFRRPTGGPALERLVGIETGIDAVGRALTPQYRPVRLTEATGGAVLDDATLATLALRAELLQEIAERQAARRAALVAYHAELGAYVRQLERARAYLAAVEEAAVRPVDSLQRAEGLLRLGLQVEDGALRSRAAFDQASRILLGTQ